MSNKQILKQAIEKVIKNGWKIPDELNINLEEKMAYDLLVGKTAVYYALIFSHSFAKEFWGKHVVCSITGLKECFCNVAGATWLPAWQYHLLRMILQEKPLQYLKKFL